MRKQTVGALFIVLLIFTFAVHANSKDIVAQVDTKHQVDKVHKVKGEPVGEKDKLALVSAIEKLAPQKTKLLANIIKNALESYHYLHYKIDDDISKKAYGEFLKKIDYGKQFLLQKDLNSLEQYKKRIDEEIVSGKLELMKAAATIFEKRVKQVEKFREDIFKKPFDFTKDEYLEVDPDKRDFVKNNKELKEHWRKVFKQSVLTRYLSLIEEQEDPKDKDKEKDKKKDKNKKKKKKEKKLTKKEMKEKAIKAISKKYKRLFTRLLKEDQDDHLEQYFNALTSVFDPHTTFMPPKRKEDFDIDISGSLEGIGAVLQEDGAHIKVVKIVPGGAAWRQKELEVDDVILMAGEGEKEPVDLVDMRVDDAVRHIRGKKGTEVRLTVKKVDGTRKVIPIIRDVIQIGESFAKSSIIEHKDLGLKVGYIHLPKFYRDFSDAKERNCSDDVRKEIKRLKSKKAQGIILDLRNNGGGSLEDAKIMTGLFIKTGPIVQVKSHTGHISVLKDTDDGVEYDGPLIVMINRFSASASEILAGALQDYGRAVIVGGEFSHGKGTVQAVLNLNQGSFMALLGQELGALKVTIQKFYRITGGSTQFRGITPDVILPDPFGYAENREKDMDNALPWDEVPKLPYSPWDKKTFELKELITRSQKRLGKNKRAQKIVESVDYLQKRRKQTNVSLNIEKVKKEDLKNKEIIKSLKIEERNESMIVSNFEDSIMDAEKIKKVDAKQWKEDSEQRKEDWIKGIQLDVGLEEAIYVLEDMIRQNKKEKLRAIN